MRYDRGYGRDFRGRGGPARHRYDFGMRGYWDTAPERPPVRMRYVGARGGYDRGFGPGYDRESGQHFGRPVYNRHVTQRYNLDYVFPEPNLLRTNYVPFGGDFPGRIVDAAGYWRPYETLSGSHTWRGGGLPIGWEREEDYGRERGYGGYGRDFRGPAR